MLKNQQQKSKIGPLSSLGLIRISQALVPGEIFAARLSPRRTLGQRFSGLRYSIVLGRGCGLGVPVALIIV